MLALDVEYVALGVSAHPSTVTGGNADLIAQVVVRERRQLVREAGRVAVVIVVAGAAFGVDNSDAVKRDVVGPVSR